MLLLMLLANEAVDALPVVVPAVWLRLFALPASCDNDEALDSSECVRLAGAERSMTSPGPKPSDVDVGAAGSLLSSSSTVEAGLEEDKEDEEEVEGAADLPP